MSYYVNKLLDGAAADGSSDAAGPLNGGTYTVFAYGTFGGATVKVQVSPDGVTFFDLTDLTFTANGCSNVTLAAGSYIRANLSSVGTTSVDVDLLG